VDPLHVIERLLLVPHPLDCGAAPARKLIAVDA
jgi:hypothetical protein